jgi:Transposase IS116/IS110/IS902 family
VSYNKQRLHRVGYFRELLATNQDIDEGLRCHETVVRLGKTESALVRSLQRDPMLRGRIERLMTIPAVGPILALTWALEVGDAGRFSSIKKAISYCADLGPSDLLRNMHAPDQTKTQPRLRQCRFDLAASGRYNLTPSDFHKFSRAEGPKGLKREHATCTERNRSTTSADGRVATEAAWLNRKKEKTEGKSKKLLTRIGLLMEGDILGTWHRKPANFQDLAKCIERSIGIGMGL